MNVSELEEFQGLSPEMVHAYLRRSGWRFAEHDPGSFEYRNARDLSVFLGWISGVARCVTDIAQAEDRSIQAVLRDVNPRLRPRLPSEEARDAHERHTGRWVAVRRDEHMEYRHTTIIRFLRGMTAVKLQFEDHRPTFDPTDEIAKWSFWPCDGNGARVRWPERDGVML